MLPEEDDEKTEFLSWVLVEKVEGEESKFLAASIDGKCNYCFSLQCNLKHCLVCSSGYVCALFVTL